MSKVDENDAINAAGGVGTNVQACMLAEVWSPLGGKWGASYSEWGPLKLIKEIEVQNGGGCDRARGRKG